MWFDSDFTGEQSLGKIQLEFQNSGGHVTDVGVGKSVVADKVAFVINAAHEPRDFLRLHSDHKESRRNTLFLENVQNLRRESGVGPVVKREGHPLGLRAGL